MIVRTLILGFLFLSINLNAQQAPMPRQISDTDQLSISKGRTENFGRQIYRFQTALEDNDRESMANMKTALVLLMKNECDGPVENSTKEQKRLLREFEKLDLNAEDSELQLFNEAKDILEDFFKLMKDKVSAFEKSISN